MRKILGLATVLVSLGSVALTLARFVTTGSRLPILLAAFSSYALVGFVLEEVTPDAGSRLVAAGLTQLLPHQAGRPSTSVSGAMVFSR